MKIPNPDDREYQTLIDADSVFRGLVTKIELAEESKLFQNTPFAKIFVRPVEVLKGEVSVDAYALTHTGYYGGCAVPALVGVQYLFAPRKDLLEKEVKQNPEAKALIDGSIGFVTIFEVAEVPENPELVDEFMAEFRNWAKSNKD